MDCIGWEQCSLFGVQVSLPTSTFWGCPVSAERGWQPFVSAGLCIQGSALSACPACFVTSFSEI